MSSVAVHEGVRLAGQPEDTCSDPYWRKTFHVQRVLEDLRHFKLTEAAQEKTSEPKTYFRNSSDNHRPPEE